MKNINNNLILIIVTILFFVTSCEKKGCSKEEDVKLVKAEIHTFKKFSEGDYRWMKYELASVKYKKNGFKLSESNFPITVPDDYLWLLSEKTINEDIVVSDIQAQIGLILVRAYDRKGEFIGDFELRSDNWCAEYIYADRDFTEKWISKNGEVIIDCSFKKGWNVRYYYYSNIVEKIQTTQKPLNEVFKWHFAGICVD